MAKCPNCGREAARTKDWVCEWCGYPLPDGSFKTIGKTFRELKEERLSGQPVVQEKETAPPVIEIRPEALSKLRPQPAKKPEPPPSPTPAVKPPSEVKTPPASKPPEPPVQPKPAARPEPVAEVKPQPIPKVAPETRAEPSAGVKPPLPPEKKTEPVAAQPAPPPEVKAAPPAADLQLTVAELLSAYEADGVAADARFTNKILKITGVVDKINVKDSLNIYSITLNSPKKTTLLQGVRCVFDKTYGNALNQLSSGQTVTVQGKYTGSVIDISIRDCILF